MGNSPRSRANTEQNVSCQSLAASPHGATGQTAAQPTEVGLRTSGFFFFLFNFIYLSIYLLFLAMPGFIAAWAFLYLQRTGATL